MCWVGRGGEGKREEGMSSTGHRVAVVMICSGHLERVVRGGKYKDGHPN